MSSTEIKYYVDNREKILEEMQKIENNLSSEELDKIYELYGEGNVEEALNIIHSDNPSVSLSSIKLLVFLEDFSLKDKLFSNEEYTNILRTLVDLYGKNLSEIIDVRNFNMKDLKYLQSFDNAKYEEIYKSVLEKKIFSAFLITDVTEILRNSDNRFISKELINNFLINYNRFINVNQSKEFLQTLPNSILQDGTIAINIIKKLSDISFLDDELLDYIPVNAYTTEFVEVLLNKEGYYFDEIFKHIPQKLRTRKVWERACLDSPHYLSELPNQNIDSNISQEEYNFWVEDLIIKIITSRPSEAAIAIFSNLNNNKKTISLCQKIAESLSLDNGKEYDILLQSIPISSRTQLLYETLVSKSPSILKFIPYKSFESNILQEEYDKWFENLILQCIDKTNDLKSLRDFIPQDKINEKVWNKFLDKCIAEGNDRNLASLEIVSFKNLTQQMIERAMRDISNYQIFELPCIDRNLDDLSGIHKEEYMKWLESIDEEQKQAYRNMYEKLWIQYVKKIGDDAISGLYSHVPKEAITTTMKMACIDVYLPSVSDMPHPETKEQLHEYQQLLLYALRKQPTLDYISKETRSWESLDILEKIPREYINDEILMTAIKKRIYYLNYANPNEENFSQLMDIAFKDKLTSMGRTELTSKEHNLMKKFALNNSDFFTTLNFEILDSKIVSVLGERSLEKITRYGDIQSLILDISKDDDALKTFGFALKNLRMDNAFTEPLIEKLANSVFHQWIDKYNVQKSKFEHESLFMNLVAQRIDKKDFPFTDYEKVIIPYLTLNPQEGRIITNYNDVLTFVERKNDMNEKIVNNLKSTLFAVKNAYLERLVGLNYEQASNLVTMFGNDPEQLLQNYKNINSDSIKEHSEKEAIEIIIKIKSLIETQDISAIRNEFNKIIKLENKEDFLQRYRNSTILETTLRRAYGRDLVNSLSKNVSSLPMQKFEFHGDTYFVRKINGNFNRMISVLNAFNKSTATDGDMYDRWNTNQMSRNHALCFSLINQSNPGTAKTNGKNGTIISIAGFSPESISGEAPYDLNSMNTFNTIYTARQQRFFSTQNMPDYTRRKYSEYDIEIQDVLCSDEQYRKIQPSTIVCFEEVDEDSIKASIELGKKLGHIVPIELIDRRELAENEMANIDKAFNDFKSSKTVNPALVREIITRFNNVRNAHRESNLSNELLGENMGHINKNAPFNIEHLNQMLKECLVNVEQRIRYGQVDEGLKALDSIKNIIFEERQKLFLIPTMDNKLIQTGIDINIDYTIDELQRIYGKLDIKPLEKIKSLEALSKMQNVDLKSVTFDVESHTIGTLPPQLSANQIIQLSDLNKVKESINEIHAEGYYQGNVFYDEEHIARVIFYSDIISKVENFDTKNRELLTDVAKYYSCGRQLDIAEKHGQYSAKLAGKALIGKYPPEEIKMIQASIEMQNLCIFSESDEEKTKIAEVYEKYDISEPHKALVYQMASYIKDAVILDRTRFAGKEKYKAPEQSINVDMLHFDISKKMMKFSYLIQDELAKMELDRLSDVIKINSGEYRFFIMKDLFTILENGMNERIKDDEITESPIVRLEYLKTKFPEIMKFDLEKFQKQRLNELITKDIKNIESSQLETLKQNLKLQQQIILDNNLSQSWESESLPGMKI